MAIYNAFWEFIWYDMNLHNFLMSFSPAGAWQVIFDDQSTITRRPPKEIATNRKFLFFISFLLSFRVILLCRMSKFQRFNCNCTKYFASSKVTPININSTFSTLSISSPIHISSPHSCSSSKCTSAGYTPQRWTRWCHCPPK